MAPGTPPASVVIVGAGQGGFQTAASLREYGHTGRITLISAEDALPYERPPLSKSFLKDDTYLEGGAQLWLRPATYYVRQDIDLVAGTVTAVDRGTRTVGLADGSTYAYDHLVLATGARPRTLDVPGAGLRGVHTLRTARDATALRQSLAAARRAVVVGAGFIGLEFAAVARESGREVMVVEACDRPLARAVSARTAAYFTRLHREAGTRVLCGHGVAAVRGGGRGGVSEVELADGRLLPADLVLTGVGVTPNTELAAAAGLVVDGGIAVDSRLLTGDPRISAVGDCAAFRHMRSGNRLRLESVQNAVGHARLVAERLTGAPPSRTYDELPWFWSDQFSTTLQIAGLDEGHDSEVVLGEGPDAFSVLLFDGDELCAVESVNRRRDHLAARRLLDGRVPLAPGEASAPGFTLKGHLSAGQPAERASRKPTSSTWKVGGLRRRTEARQLHRSSNQPPPRSTR
ncbi:pyridine nucleotide-disulfide oxidoreductase [Streptomyces kanamyceticus]|uniref:Pyridine nucleotide-disulfide oxidoreductase n=1 Tax=Streptomyces kanamyceticus TaxID=1967 RepID=A0A5J6G2I4_STRKN|nr:pyridine nucleotide-disulfide oxidoreductase [Streptomyces kanamyceticus]